MRRGLLAEFGSPEALVAAVAALRELGYAELEAFAPYPVEGLDEALGLRRSRVSTFVLAAGLAGAAAAYLVQWWTNAVDYPLDVGGRPLHSAPAFVPITFETTVLFAALAAFLAPLLLTGLPRLWHPVFEAEGFESASIDGYWLGIDAHDPRLDDGAAGDHLRQLGARRVVPVGGELF